MRHTSWMIGLAAALAVVAAPASAGAAEPWSAPVPIADSSEPGVVSGPLMAFTRAGNGIVAYLTTTSSFPDESSFHTIRARGAVSSPGAAFGPARTLGRFGLEQLAAYGSDRVIGFGFLLSRARAVVAYGSPGAGLGASHQIWPGHAALLAGAAVNERGDAAARPSARPGPSRPSRPAPSPASRGRRVCPEPACGFGSPPTGGRCWHGRAPRTAVS